jgi:type IV secretion system protein VirB11
VFTLEDKVAAMIITTNQAEFLCSAVAERCKILVPGGTSTGKATLVDALLAEIAKAADRWC